MADDSSQDPSHHAACNTKLEQRTVLVDRRVLNINPYPVEYCPKCELYICRGAESKDPEKLGELITITQEQQNKESHGSRFSKEYLEQLKQKP